MNPLVLGESFGTISYMGNPFLGICAHGTLTWHLLTTYIGSD